MKGTRGNRRIFMLAGHQCWTAFIHVATAAQLSLSAGPPAISVTSGRDRAGVSPAAAHGGESQVGDQNDRDIQGDCGAVTQLAVGIVAPAEELTAAVESAGMVSATAQRHE